MLEVLEDAALAHLKASKLILEMLKDMSKNGRITYDPYKCVKEGSYFLTYAHRIVEVYSTCANGKIYDKNVQKIDDVLASLEFNCKHLSEGYSMENHNGRLKGFLSKGQGAKYYEMLHGSEKGVQDFIKIAENDINESVQNLVNDLKNPNEASRILKTFARDFTATKSHSKSVDFAVEAIEDHEKPTVVKDKSLVKKTRIFTNNYVFVFSIFTILIGEAIKNYL